MPPRAKSICRKPGCSALVDSPGYCQKHTTMANPFAALERTNRPFYGSSAWTRASLAHRRMQPLCQECLSRGITKKGELVHHEPALEILLQRGLNPLNPAYLVTLCTRCHTGHLRAKRL